ncbi:MAG: hypothetical protein IPH20_14525 [Bacteroidales bacterium]|nr:hypothetical protein [Bacteroidales bacterium]
MIIFFSNHKNIYFVNSGTEAHKPIEEYEPTDLLSDRYVNRLDLSIHDTKGENKVKIIAVRKLLNSRARHVCPECNTENTVSMIGTRVATMSSITVSQILASDLDSRDEKYRKVLAFTNSVQDAAHQAGFIEARNYRFTFRSSLQRVLNELNRPVSIDELQKEFISYWKHVTGNQVKKILKLIITGSFLLTTVAKQTCVTTSGNRFLINLLPLFAMNLIIVFPGRLLLSLVSMPVLAEHWKKPGLLPFCSRNKHSRKSTGS